MTTNRNREAETLPGSFLPVLWQAAILAIELLDFCANAQEQRKMQKEADADDYNLSAFRIDATAISISETSWEK